MRLLTKAEACRELAVSLSTLDRRIASGELLTRRSRAGGGTGCTWRWTTTRHKRRAMRPASGSLPWRRRGFEAWRNRWPSCKDNSKRNGNATPGWRRGVAVPGGDSGGRGGEGCRSRPTQLPCTSPNPTGVLPTFVGGSVQSRPTYRPALCLLS